MSIESNKTLGGIGAILTAIGFIVPVISIIGIILVLVSLKGLAEYYNENLIFQNALYGIIFYIIAVIVSTIVLIGSVFGILAGASWGHIPLFVSGAIAALVVMFIFYLIGTMFFKRSFDALSAKSGEKMFNTAGLVLLMGAILIIIFFVGIILMLVAWILAAVAFFSLKTISAQPLPVQAPPPPPL
ncbi:MAG: DUF996 domain-containing protein [Candidatus Bathyarchaeia archaeon]